MTKQSKSGFTLIELLVVIVIIALLAAILFPVFAKARERARQTTCLSNIKQIGLALTQYQGDYDETNVSAFFGPATCKNHPNPEGSAVPCMSWLDVIYPYVKNTNVYNCPDEASKTIQISPVAAGGTPAINPYQYRGDGSFGGYSINNSYYNNNGSVYLKHSPDGVPISRIEAPSTTFWVTEGNGGLFNGPRTASAGQIGTPRNELDPRIIIYNGNAPNAIVERHSGRTNMLYCDGHVKTKNLDEFTKAVMMKFTINNNIGPVVPEFTIEDD